MSLSVCREEAAHAVVARALGYVVIETRIGADEGHVEIADPEINPRDRAVVLLAGHALEYVADESAGFALDCRCPDCDQAKFNVATEREFKACAEDAVALVREHAAEIERVSEEIGAES